MFEIDFSVLKNKEGRIVGFSAIAQPHTESEFFCGSFLSALWKGKASIQIKDEEIDFIHPTCEFPGTFSVKVEAEEIEAIALLMKDTKKLGLYKDGILTPGFRIVLIKEKDNISFS